MGGMVKGGGAAGGVAFELGEEFNGEFFTVR